MRELTLPEALEARLNKVIRDAMIEAMRIFPEVGTSTAVISLLADVSIDVGLGIQEICERFEQVGPYKLDPERDLYI